MQQKKKPKIFRVQHNPEIERKSQADLPADGEQATPENKVNTLVNELIRINEGMPTDLIKGFWNDTMRVASIEGVESAVAYINNTLPKTEKGLGYVLSELERFLGQRRDRMQQFLDSNNASDGEQEDEQDETEGDPDEVPMDDRGLNEVPNFSEGEIVGDLEQFLRERIQKTVNYLNELLARIKKLELRADKTDTDLASIQKDVKELKDFNEALPDFLAAKVSQVLSDNRSAYDVIPANVIEICNRDTGEIARVESIVPKEWQTMVELASARKNILLVGPSGCGKSYITEVLAKALQLRYGSISCSEGMSEGDIKGWLLPMGEGGKFVYVPSDFVDMYENGGLFNADELDAADANFGIFLNKAISNGSFHLAIRRGNTLVKKHKDFVFVACANTFGNGSDFIYVGRNQLDGATLDRFRCGVVTMDYDQDVEKGLIDPDVLTWGTFIRKAITDTRQTKRMMTTRFMIDITDMKKMYSWGPEKWEKQFFSDWSKDDRKRVEEHVRRQVEEAISRARGGR